MVRGQLVQLLDGFTIWRPKMQSSIHIIDHIKKTCLQISIGQYNPYKYTDVPD